jgi:hypothetical protein
MSTYNLADGTTNIDTQLTQNAYVIGEAIYAKILNSSKWNAVTPKSKLPTNVGDALVSLVYNSALPATTANGSVPGLNWTNIASDILGANALNTNTSEQAIAGAAGETIGVADPMSFVKWTKMLRDYHLQITRIRSPWLDVNDFRTAAGIEKQTAAVMKALKGSVQWGWERRHQEQFERISRNLVPCRATGTPIREIVDADGDGTADDDFYEVSLAGANGAAGTLDFRTSGAGNSDVTPDAYISNAVLDLIHDQLQRVTDISDAWGVDNGAPVYALMISTQASYRLKTESGIRDDVRRSSMVDSLIKPLGISESFRGFYHMTDPSMPRFTMASGVLTRVEPLTTEGLRNAAYDTAPYEAAYVVHKEVLECQVPDPNYAVPGGGIVFDPVSYMGDWKWLNTKDNVVNLVGDKGFFLGTLSSATKPKNPEWGYVILFNRTATTYAA